MPVGGLGAVVGFPDSSVGKESTCNAVDPGSIPGLGRSAGEGIGYPLHYSWASLMVQLLKNLPAMWETWVWSLAWEDPLEKGKATHSSILGLENSMDCVVHGVTRSQTQLSDFHSLTVGEQVVWGGKEGFTWRWKSSVVSKGSRGHRSSLPIPGSLGAVEWGSEFMAERTRL